MLNCIAMAPPFAQVVPDQESFLGWAIGATSFTTLFVFATGLLIFVGACYLVATRKRPAVIAAYLVLLPLPVLISLCGWMKGMITSLAVIATMQNPQFTSADIAGATASSLLELLLAMLVSAPTYLLLAIGLLIRSLQRSSNFAESVPISP